MVQVGVAHMGEPRPSKQHLASGGSFGSQSAAKATGPRTWREAKHLAAMAGKPWENHGKTPFKPGKPP